jgi:uncharacterized membrane protein YedE/YeeE
VTAAAHTRSRVAAIVTAALAGALFGAGLVISGMTQPARIVHFLDPLSGWDPSLAFVMAGAVAVYATCYAGIRRRLGRPWFDIRFHVPTRTDIDPPLVAGAAIFGIGWGLGGLCPGPAIVAAVSGTTSTIAFVLAMIAGMYAADSIPPRRRVRNARDVVTRDHDDLPTARSYRRATCSTCTRDKVPSCVSCSR